MNLFSFAIVVFGLYFIFAWIYRSWRNAEIKQKMRDIEIIEKQHKEVKLFKRDHKNPKPKKKEIKDFIKDQY